MERVRGIEPLSRPWQGRIIATIRYPQIMMVPRAGIEPALYRYNWILSPARLPVPPPRLFLSSAEADKSFVEMMGVEPMSNR